MQLFKFAGKNDDSNLDKLPDLIDGEKVKFEQASEPTDIIWENRHFSKKRRRRCQMLIVFLLALALFFSFIVIFYGTKW